MKRILVVMTSLFLTACATIGGPFQPWQKPTQKVTVAQWQSAFDGAKSMQSASIEEGETDTIIRVPSSASSPDTSYLFIFTKPNSDAYPAASKVTLSKGSPNSKSPDFHFLKVGNNPAFPGFVRAVLISGFMLATESPDSSSKAGAVPAQP